MNIIDIATLVNPELTPLNILQARYQWGDRNQKIFSRFLQLESACLFPGVALRQLLQNCLEKLLAKHPDKRGQIGYLAYAHSLHSTFPFSQHVLREIAAQSLSSRTEILSTTQNSCASSFNALALLESQLRHDEKPGPRYAILLTGDKCFHQTVQYVNQNGVFGEGCSALLLSADSAQPGCVIKGIGRAMIGGIGGRTRQSSREQENRYDHHFMPTMMRAIHHALTEARIDAGQLQCILPYHMSPVTFDRIADQLQLPRSRIMRANLYRLGHCFCGDSFINLHDYSFGNSRRNTGYFLAVAAGVAGSFSAMIFDRQ